MKASAYVKTSARQVGGQAHADKEKRMAQSAWRRAEKTKRILYILLILSDCF
jgi:hypothetical protein